MVSITTWELPGAVQVHQTDAPPILPAWLGSPASLVAPTLEPETVRLAPLRVIRLAKLLLAGWAWAVVIATMAKQETPREPSSFFMGIASINNDAEGLCTMLKQNHGLRFKTRNEEAGYTHNNIPATA